MKAQLSCNKPKMNIGEQLVRSPARSKAGFGTMASTVTSIILESRKFGAAHEDSETYALGVEHKLALCALFCLGPLVSCLFLGPLGARYRGGVRDDPVPVGRKSR
jgi:hypothetical protein